MLCYHVLLAQGSGRLQDPSIYLWGVKEATRGGDRWKERNCLPLCWVWIAMSLQGHAVGLLHLKCWACDLACVTFPLPACCSGCVSGIWSTASYGLSCPPWPHGQTELTSLEVGQDVGWLCQWAVLGNRLTISGMWPLLTRFRALGVEANSSLSCLPQKPVVR